MPPKTIYNFEKVNIHRKLFFENKSLREIAREYGCNLSTLLFFMKKNGIELKTGIDVYTNSIIDDVKKP